MFRSPIYSQPRRGSIPIHFSAALLFIVLAIVGFGIVAAVYRLPLGSRAGLQVTTNLLPKPPVPVPKGPPPIDVAAVYRNDIRPLLATFEQRNKDAVDRAVADLHDRLNARRTGIEPFVEDINSWGTRFRVVRRKASDFKQKYWNKNKQSSADAYINGKFRELIYSEDALRADIGASLAKLRSDLVYNKNTLYVELGLRLKAIKLPVAIDDAHYLAFTQRVDEATAKMLEGVGGDSVVKGVLTLVGSTVAFEAATQIVRYVIAAVGAAIAVDGIEAGGATVAGTAVGGGSGSVAGPAGTAIGAGVGLVVGCAVDWWMSAKFAEKMTKQLNGYFDDLEKKLISGGTDWPGLKSDLSEAVRVQNVSQRKAIATELGVPVSEQ